ncbi:hypothetical protein C1T17_18335 [Sphingobium sp. SCG-1]|uniref:DUF6152 family protein n=1 Tax=Sphingobium sp. SCG-1 TaxID=2072936 RepID=UPI000CD6BCC9|nr:DUF6152 family protein [Sphingobium sp. SCG-1]AUW59743.1 hypothetical protein C1T17_18335 [Sphingobium sp. SCG-1]
MQRPVTAILAFAALVAPFTAQAHHGWAWTTGKNIEIPGKIVEAKLGNPHGLVTVDVRGARWTIEVGQPWRNEQAGLKDADFTKGATMRFVGEPSANAAVKRMKAEKILIGNRSFVLYPERD